MEYQANGDNLKNARNEFVELFLRKILFFI